MKTMSVPSIQLDIDGALDRKCSILFPEEGAEDVRNKRKLSFATFQIVDDKNCGMGSAFTYQLGLVKIPFCYHLSTLLVSIESNSNWFCYAYKLMLLLSFYR